ncbi:MAG: COG1361 S-layer family protein [Candidatus Woesearchaeota archaeon]
MRQSTKILAFLVLFSLITLFSIQGADAQSIDHPKIDVTLQSYDPFPLEPGSFASLKFRATNVGDEVATDPSFELVSQYPFRIVESEDTIKEFNKMSPRESVTFEYKVRVADDAPIGSFPVKLKSSSDGEAWTSSEHDVLIRIEESILSVRSVSTDPEILPPGDISTLSVVLENSGSTMLRDVSLKLNFDADVEGEIPDMLPFAPSGSTGQKTLRSIPGGDNVTLDLDIMTFSDAESGIYRLPISLSYRDESGDFRTTTGNIGLIVGAEPRLSATLDSVDYKPGDTELSFRIVNRGVTDLKFVNAELGEADDYEILSPSNEFYIGRLSSDDFDSISFRVSLDEAADVISIPFSVDYLDANNREHVDEFDIEVDLENVRRTASQDGDSVAIAIAIIVFAVFGFYLYRRKRRQKRR